MVVMTQSSFLLNQQLLRKYEIRAVPVKYNNTVPMNLDPQQHYKCVVIKAFLM